MALHTFFICVDSMLMLCNVLTAKFKGNLAMLSLYTISGLVQPKFTTQDNTDNLFTATRKQKKL